MLLVASSLLDINERAEEDSSLFDSVTLSELEEGPGQSQAAEATITTYNKFSGVRCELIIY